MSASDSDAPHVPAGGIVTVGNFDGVHRGHQRMLKTLCEVAGARNTQSVVVTFHPHPITVLRPNAVLHRLTTPERRARLLRRYGADQVVVLPITDGLLQLSPQAFFQAVLVDQLQARGVVEGPNFHFGKDRAGDVNLLQQLCEARGMYFQVISPVSDADQMISSSRVRELLIAGQLAASVRLLGHPHQLCGTVTRGAGRGRGLGFPTANLQGIDVLLPGHGVYAAACTLDDQRYPTAVNVGPNPTFNEHSVKVECHLDGFHGDLYGRTLAVDLLSEIRPLQSFNSVGDLTTQVSHDVAACREICAKQA